MVRPGAKTSSLTLVKIKKMSKISISFLENFIKLAQAFQISRFEKSIIDENERKLVIEPRVNQLDMRNSTGSFIVLQVALIVTAAQGKSRLRYEVDDKQTFTHIASIAFKSQLFT